MNADKDLIRAFSFSNVEMTSGDQNNKDFSK